MTETCDRCGPAVRAAYRASHGGQLYLCGHCANQLRPALSAQGWDIWPIGGYVLAPRARQRPRPARRPFREDLPNK